MSNFFLGSRIENGLINLVLDVFPGFLARAII